MRTFSEFLKVYRALTSQKASANTVIDNSKELKIALLSSFTTKGMKEIITVMCCDEGIPVKVYEGNYGQYAQEVYSDGSGLYSFDPDVAVFLMDLENICPDYLLNPYSLSLNQRIDLIEQIKKTSTDLIDMFISKHTGTVVFNNFLVPHYSPLGMAEDKQEFGFLESIEYLNSYLAKQYKANSRVYIFDFNQWASIIGKANIRDAKIYFQGDIKISLRYLPVLCQRYMTYFRSLTNAVKKCLVLDLDNTLWGGIIGEDGIENIKLGLQYEGKAFYEFQKSILALYNRGVILAINSKNNWEDVKLVLEKHPYMVLKESHFASIQVNWNDKASNMTAIAKELNISTDSFVFMDDDNINCDLIKTLLPEVLTIKLPEDHSLYVECLQSIAAVAFDSPYFSKEDAQKGKMYAQQRERNAMLKTGGLHDYLRELNTIITVSEMSETNEQRIAQLMQKTNQFNTTTRRHTLNKLLEMASSGFKLLCVSISDKFGDSGVCGLLIYKESNEKCTVESFLLSCRVLGRNIEYALTNYLFDRSATKNIEIEFMETNKNAQVRTFLENVCNLIEKNDNEIEIWRLDNKKIHKAEYITFQN